MFKRGFFTIAVMIAGMCLLYPPRRIIWHASGFRQIEYEFVFQDSTGNPLPNVKLEVRDDAGTVAYGYPIDDFSEDSTPTSDGQGRLVFHHVSRACEFTRKDELVFFVSRIPVRNDGIPIYYCRFSLDNRVVFEKRLDSLEQEFLTLAGRDGKTIAEIRTAEGEVQRLESSVFKKTIKSKGQ